MSYKEGDFLLIQGSVLIIGVVWMCKGLSHISAALHLEIVVPIYEEVRLDDPSDLESLWITPLEFELNSGQMTHSRSILRNELVEVTKLFEYGSSTVNCSTGI